MRPPRRSRSVRLPVDSHFKIGGYSTLDSDQFCAMKIERVISGNDGPIAKGPCYCEPHKIVEIWQVFKELKTERMEKEVICVENHSVQFDVAQLMAECNVHHFCSVKGRSNEKADYFCRFKYSYDNPGQLLPVISLQPSLQKAKLPKIGNIVEEPGIENVRATRKSTVLRQMENFDDNYVSESESSSDSEAEVIVAPSPPKKSKPAKNPSTTVTKKNLNAKTMDISKASKEPQATASMKYQKSLADELERILNLDDDFSKMRKLLNPSAVPPVLPCRENEFANLLSFIEQHLINGTSGCMYISGTPGTGKTATFFEAMNCLNEASANSEVPKFQFIDVNGLRVTSPHEVYTEIFFKLTGIKLGSEAALEQLDRRFVKSAPDKTLSVILLVDELDLLINAKQDVLYNLFDWPSSKTGGQLIIVCIANTMDLPEKVMMKRVYSRLGLTRVVFQPYTRFQLQEIVSSRLQSTNLFSPDAIEFVARKVSALSGDARRTLEISRRACELASKKKAPKINISHVNEALKEMFSSPKVIALGKCSKHEKLFLRSIVSEFRKSGIEEAVLKNIYVQYSNLCSLEGERALNAELVLRFVSKLNVMKLILTEGGSARGMLQKVLLNVTCDDILYALAPAN